MKAKILSVSVILFFTISLKAAETDGFTNRYAPLADSSLLINERANKYVERALNDLKMRQSGCDERAFYKELRKYFANHLSGALVKAILNDDAIPKRPVILANSVYKDWSAWDGLGLGVTFISRKGITVSPVLNFNNELIGADKFEHFFGQGFAYFTTNYLKNHGAIKAIKGGIAREKFFLGGSKIGNGIFSYGDLAANFNGMRFWNHILQKHDDILGSDHNIGPYVQCDNDQWIQVKKIDFADYIDASMDESINCSKFPSLSTVRKFKGEVKALGMTCPLEPHKLQEMIVKYGPISKWIINPVGNGVIHYFKEFKSRD